MESLNVNVRRDITEHIVSTMCVWVKTNAKVAQLVSGKMSEHSSVSALPGELRDISEYETQSYLSFFIRYYCKAANFSNNGKV